jgi:hypothetical protein
MCEEEVMRYPLAASPADVLPSRHPTQTGRADRCPGIRRLGFFLGFWIALSAFTPSPASPASAGESIWMHNGSTVRWVSSGEDRWMYYLEPPTGARSDRGAAGHTALPGT